VIEVTSPDNPRYRQLLRLMQSGRERRKAGLTLLDGVHLVQAYGEQVGIADELIVSRSGASRPEVQALLAAGGQRALMLSDALFRVLSTVETPTGVMALVRSPPPRPLDADIGPCVVLDSVQDPGNLGSILRSASAFGVRDVLLTEGCAQVWSPRVLRAGMGAHFALHLYERCDIGAFASRYPGRLLATVRDEATPVFETDLRGDVALLFGSEGRGLSPALAALAHARISIPMPGHAESLNVAAAAAICLFERVRQLQGKA